MGGAPEPGWWMASDGRYYPPELAPGQPEPVSPVSPVAPEQTRRPVYKRAWFWIVIGLGALIPGVVVAVILIGIFISTGPVEPSTLAVVESTDFATVTEGTERTGDEWSAVVSGGALRITPTQPGTSYPSWTALDDTNEVKVKATMTWPEGALAADEILLVGVTVSNQFDGGGYGLACGNDGYVHTLLIGPDETVTIGSTADEACLEDQFTLSLGVASGNNSDMLRVELPGGENSLTFPGSVLGPFTEAGFVMATEDESITVPGVAVHSVEIQAAP